MTAPANQAHGVRGHCGHGAGSGGGYSTVPVVGVPRDSRNQHHSISFLKACPRAPLKVAVEPCSVTLVAREHG